MVRTEYSTNRGKEVSIKFLLEYCLEYLGVDSRITMNSKQTGWEDVDWSHVAQDMEQGDGS
jgi:hypothetical protein